ncbi:MAG: type II toxin-antitoxin system VapC family toxin [Burkholderiales bacterium]|nr:type II toxin-antitoxin system VapC family toxin [Anaerolineae bacterium]
MTTTTTICVDINVAIQLVVAEDTSVKAKSLWQSWAEADTQLVVPSLFWYEAASILSKKVHRQLITDAESTSALITLMNMPFQTISVENLHMRALEMALRLKQPQAYDAHYLVIAQAINCEFWTDDERLYRTALQEVPQIKWFRNY